MYTVMLRTILEEVLINANSLIFMATFLHIIYRCVWRIIISRYRGDLEKAIISNTSFHNYVCCSRAAHGTHCIPLLRKHEKHNEQWSIAGPERLLSLFSASLLLVLTSEEYTHILPSHFNSKTIHSTSLVKYGKKKKLLLFCFIAQN
jgi:hypothetical protein